MKLDTLRTALHRAIDDAIDLYARGQAATAHRDPDDLEITDGDATGGWSFRWPDGAEEPFYSSKWYHPRWRDGEASVRLAWTRREAWGRTLRVVFSLVK